MPIDEYKLKIFRATDALVDAKTPAAAEVAVKSVALFSEVERARIFYLAGEFIAQEFKRSILPADEPRQEVLTDVFNSANTSLFGVILKQGIFSRALVAELHAQMIVVNAVYKEMGEQTNPLLKTYAEEAAKLTDAQYNTSTGLLGFVTALSESVYPVYPAATKPFRQKPKVPK